MFDTEQKFSIMLTLGSIGTSNIDNKDIIDCYFVEDIYGFCSSGKLIFNDIYGVLEFGPFTGNEYITIVYGTMEEKIRVFEIFKVNRVQQLSAGTESGVGGTFEVSFVDSIFSKMTRKRFSLSWSNKKISTIIRDITENIVGITTFNEFEETSNTLPYFYSPYWTPQESISWLLKRGRSSVNGKAGYLYWYNNVQGINYVTLETLLSNKIILKLPVGTKTSNESIWSILWFEKGKGVYGHDINRILGWEILGIDNTGTKDVFGKHLLGYDSSTKSFINNSYKYSDSIKNYTMLGESTLFTIDVDNEDSEYVLEGESDSEMLNNIYYNDFIKKYSVQQCISVLLPGHEGRYPGAMVEIKWPTSSVGIAPTELFNKNMIGKSLIKSITHSFSPDLAIGYRQRVVLIKNAYWESDYADLIKSTNANY